MQTTYVGCTAGAPLGAPGTFYRLTLAADAGWYDGAKFASRARHTWDTLASSGMAFPATPLAVTAEDTATTFDIRLTTPGVRVCAELVRWVEELHSGTVHVARLERLGGTLSQDDSARTRTTQQVEEQRAQESAAGQLASVATGVRNTAIVAAVVILLLLAVIYRPRVR